LSLADLRTVRLYQMSPTTGDPDEGSDSNARTGIGTGRKRGQYEGLIQQTDCQIHENLLLYRDWLRRSAVELFG